MASRRHLTRALAVTTITAALAAAAGVIAPAYASTPTAPPVATPVVLDSFTRTVGAGFGTSPQGSPWIGDPSRMSVNGSRALMALTASTARSAVLYATPVQDTDAVTSFGINTLPTTGSVYLAQMLRTSSDGAFIGPRIRILADKTIVAGIRYSAADGATTSIGSDVIVGARMTSASTRLLMRSRIQGRSVAMRVWVEGTPEPSAWMVTGTSPIQPTAAGFGVWAYLGSGTNPITVNVDDVAVTSLDPANSAPTAQFNAAASDLTAVFDARSSSDVDGSVSSYAWTFGDGATAEGATVTHTYGVAGTYPVTLTVTDNRAATSSRSQLVTVAAPNLAPTAVFRSQTTDLDVAFDASASSDPDGTIATYAWDFGDGTTAAGRTVSKHYNTAGSYNVKLTVTDNRGGSATSTHPVTVIAPNILPTASLRADITDLTATLDGSASSDPDGTIATYAWDFGDGTTATGVNASKVYTKPGDYTVKLTVTDNRGGQNTTARSLTAIAPNIPPVAGFTSTVNDLDVAFDGSQSVDPDGTIVAYAWDFGDGTTGTGKTVSKHYAAAGNYTVTLKVTDNRNGTATKSTKVTAIAPNIAPTASFASSATDLGASFDASGSFDPDGTVTAYAWNFGDGTTATGKAATKQYSAGGTYTVTLTVTDNRGGTATATKQITVIAPNVAPTASFTATQQDLTTALDATASKDPDGTIAGYAWNFGDGTTGSGATTSKTYSGAGTYTVTLTVTDNRGATATVTRTVTATKPAPVRPSASNTGVPAGTKLTVYNGDLTITTPNTVIDSMDIRGFVVVKAANVTIKRSIIRGGTTAPTASKGLLSIVAAGASGYLIQDVTLLPQISTPNIDAIKVNQPGTFDRINSSGTVDGMVIYGDGVTVQNSFIHDEAHFEVDPNQGGGPSHDDNIQVQAGHNITIVNNTLQGAYNAAVMITQDSGVTQNLSINNNWIDGGGCSLNYGSKGSYKTGMQANNNRFGRNQRVAGCAIIHNAAVSDLNPQGNVWDDNGTPATIKRGA